MENDLLLAIYFGEFFVNAEYLLNKTQKFDFWQKSNFFAPEY